MLLMLSAAALLAASAVKGQDPYLDNASESARRAKNPFNGQRKAADAGKKLYDEHCAKCHAANAKGGGNVPSLVSGPVQAAPMALPTTACRLGRACRRRNAGSL
jgi:mono/diheme cytochrome c family protein